MGFPVVEEAVASAPLAPEPVSLSIIARKRGSRSTLEKMRKSRLALA